MAGKKQIHKSAVTGKIVSPKYAATHPKTTFKQTVSTGKKKGK